MKSDERPAVDTYMNNPSYAGYKFKYGCKGYAEGDGEDWGWAPAKRSVGAVGIRASAWSQKDGQRQCPGDVDERSTKMWLTTIVTPEERAIRRAKVEEAQGKKAARIPRKPREVVGPAFRWGPAEVAMFQIRHAERRRAIAVMRKELALKRLAERAVREGWSAEELALKLLSGGPQ
jgi:hypothetical protein